MDGATLAAFEARADAAEKRLAALEAKLGAPPPLRGRLLCPPPG